MNWNFICMWCIIFSLNEWCLCSTLMKKTVQFKQDKLEFHTYVIWWTGISYVCGVLYFIYTTDVCAPCSYWREKVLELFSVESRKFEAELSYFRWDSCALDHLQFPNFHRNNGKICMCIGCGWKMKYYRSVLCGLCPDVDNKLRIRPRNDWQVLSMFTLQSVNLFDSCISDYSLAL